MHTVASQAFCCCRHVDGASKLTMTRPLHTHARNLEAQFYLCHIVLTERFQTLSVRCLPLPALPEERRGGYCGSRALFRTDWWLEGRGGIFGQTARRTKRELNTSGNDSWLHFLFIFYHRSLLRSLSVALCFVCLFSCLRGQTARRTKPELSTSGNDSWLYLFLYHRTGWEFFLMLCASFLCFCVCFLACLVKRRNKQNLN